MYADNADFRGGGGVGGGGSSQSFGGELRASYSSG